MLELRILTGLHRGTALPLDGEVIHIGCGSENDISLLDPGMAKHAGVLVRTSESAWEYRSCIAGQPNGGVSVIAEGPRVGAAIVAGTRWFVGPVLLGCDEEQAPWPAEPVPSPLSPPAKRRFGARASAGTAIAAMVIVISLTALIITRTALSESRAEPAASIFTPSRASASGSPPESPRAPARVVKGALYPSGTVGRPPFTIRSASAGPYGFLVTDDNQVLVPGSRWKAFTLVRIEPGRAVFSGPHAAELTW